MRFKIPGQDVSVRLFERVKTTDSQYDIFDVGLEQSDGSIDSMVVGGSFSYAKSLVSAMDKKAEEKKSTATVTVLATEATDKTPAAKKSTSTKTAKPAAA